MVSDRLSYRLGNGWTLCADGIGRGHDGTINAAVWLANGAAHYAGCIVIDDPASWEPWIEAAASGLGMPDAAMIKTGLAAIGRGVAEQPPAPSRPLAPALAPELVPEPLRAWVVDVARSHSVPLEFVAVPLVVALGSVIGRTCAILPNRYDDWHTVPNLWGCLVAPPGTRKSDALRAALAPLQHLESRAAEENRLAAQEATGRLRALDAEIRGLEARIAKQAGEEVDTLRAQLLDRVAARERAGIVERRYIVSDTTIERLGMVLNNNPRGVLLCRDELAGWIRTFDKSGREGDRQAYLECWNGTHMAIVDRMCRPTLHFPATLSVIGTIQPGVLTRYVRDATGGGAGDDGLMQRFQLLVYSDTFPHYQARDHWPNREARERVDRLITALDGLDPAPRGAIAAATGIPAFRFSCDAQDAYEAWRQHIEDRIHPDGAHEVAAFVAHLSKYVGLIPKLALLFHLVNLVDRDTAGPVSLAAVQLAIQWGRFLEAHAAKLYAGDGAAPGSGTDLDTALIETISSMGDQVRNGKLSVADITQAYTAGRPQNQRVSERAVAKRLRALHLYDGMVTSPTGGAAILWNPERLGHLGATSVNQWSESSESSATSTGTPDHSELSDHSDDESEERDSEELAYAEEIGMLDTGSRR